MIVQTKAELEPLIDDRVCRQLLRGAFHFAAIIRDLERSEPVRLGQQISVESLSSHKLLGEYLKYREVPSD
jgi:hypothetical protein